MSARSILPRLFPMNPDIARPVGAMLDVADFPHATRRPVPVSRHFPCLRYHTSRCNLRADGFQMFTCQELPEYGEIIVRCSLVKASGRALNRLGSAEPHGGKNAKNMRVLGSAAEDVQGPTIGETPLRGKDAGR